MARTTSSLVQGILLRDYDGSSDLGPFINAASLMVDRVSICATNREVPLSSDELEMVERWLAAHLYASVDQPYESKRTADSSAKFQGKTGMYLEGTKYGQMAAKMDPSGCLEAIAAGQRKVAGLVWLGLPPSDQLTYEQRD